MDLNISQGSHLLLWAIAADCRILLSHTLLSTESCWSGQREIEWDFTCLTSKPCVRALCRRLFNVPPLNHDVLMVLLKSADSVCLYFVQPCMMKVVTGLKPWMESFIVTFVGFKTGSWYAVSGDELGLEAVRENLEILRPHKAVFEFEMS